MKCSAREIWLRHVKYAAREGFISFHFARQEQNFTIRRQADHFTFGAAEYFTFMPQFPAIFFFSPEKSKIAFFLSILIDKKENVC